MTPVEEIQELGFTVLKDFIKKPQIDLTLAKIIELEKISPKLEDQYIPRLNKSSPNIYNLEAKDKHFIDLFTLDSKLEQILMYFLNDSFYAQIPHFLPNYKIRSLGARSSGDALPLHIDSFFPYTGPNVIALQCILFLEDSRIDNGCTIAVPKSHLSGKYANDNKRKEAITIEAKAGSIYIQDARLWHGTLGNQSIGTRWSCVMTVSRWFITQHFNCDGIPLNILGKCSPKQKAILGLCSKPLDNELSGVDIKKGYS